MHDWLLLSVCVTSILRMKTLDNATSSRDTTWNAIPCIMWTIIETNLGIICACLPTFRQLLPAAFPRVSGRLNSIESQTRNTSARCQHRKREAFGLDTIDSYPSRWIAELRSMELRNLGGLIKPRRDNDEQVLHETEVTSAARGKTTPVVVPYYRCDAELGSKERFNPSQPTVGMAKSH